MASERITCPDCKSVLKPAKPVPDGKKVRCPKCGNQFTTPGLLEEEVIQVVEEELPRKKAPGKKKAKTGIKKASGHTPPRKKPIDDDDEDGGGIYSFVGANKTTDEEGGRPEIEYAPDMSIKDLRGPAQSAVVKPSNFILLINGLSVLANIFLICVQFWPMVFSESCVDWKKVLSKHYKEDQNEVKRVEGIKEFKEVKDKDLAIVQDAEEIEKQWRFGMMGVFLVLLVYNAIVIVGAVKMQNLESRRWGIVSSIMTLLPMGAGGFGYLIYFAFTATIGGWLLDELADPYGMGLGALPYLFAIHVSVTSLRVLMSQEVIDGFEYVPD
jgi:predicted Zn finger-like uncharacterized protein